MTSPVAVVAGLDPGASNVGTVCWVSTATGPVVLEGVTVEIVGAGPLAVTDLALRAVATARQILIDHQDTIGKLAADAGVPVPAVLFCVENLIPPRRDSQQQRAVAASNKVQTAVLATGLCLGAILALLDGELVEIVQPAGWDHRKGGPDVLRGRQPEGWRGRKGSERQHQRSAFFLSEDGLRAWIAAGHQPAPAVGPRVLTGATPTAPGPVVVQSAPTAKAAAVSAWCCIDAQYGLDSCTHGSTPAKPEPAPAVVVPAPRALPPRPTPTVVPAVPVGYVDQLVDLVRQARPATVAALAVAAQDALSLVAAPDGQTEPTAADLAHLAVDQHGVAPLLRLLPDLHAQLTTTTTRSTR